MTEFEEYQEKLAERMLWDLLYSPVIIFIVMPLLVLIVPLHLTRGLLTFLLCPLAWLLNKIDQVIHL
ncbi:hypothetical protein AGMMS50225_19160 [Betaproteobacteria bacterium]|nr:hypothetical protein AGMMS50225_19160 [Betaproteobacteria bacterium]